VIYSLMVIEAIVMLVVSLKYNNNGNYFKNDKCCVVSILCELLWFHLYECSIFYTLRALSLHVAVHLVNALKQN